ncbi:exported hypothetical protein [Bacillus sp. 349Y]|nr:exported hypothetical protein [Bacillus sp. 349Y]
MGKKECCIMISLFLFLFLSGCVPSIGNENSEVNAESELSAYRDVLNDSYFKAKEDISLCMVDGYYGDEINYDVKMLQKELKSGVFTANQYEVKSKEMVELKDEILSQGKLLSALLDNAKESEIFKESYEVNDDAEVSEAKQSEFIVRYTELTDEHYALVKDIDTSDKKIDTLLE